MVKAPMGGRKKKLNASVAAIEASNASMKPHVLAMINTSSRYANPTVVGLFGIKLRAAYVTITTPARDDTTRRASRPNVVHHPRLHSSVPSETGINFRWPAANPQRLPTATGINFQVAVAQGHAVFAGTCGFFSEPQQS